MRGQIKEVLTGLSKACVIVTHDQLEALTMADRIAIMRDGLIEQIASPHAIFSRPGNVFVASFIGTPQMNLVEATLAGMNGNEAHLGFGERGLKIVVDPAVAALPRGSRVTFGIRPRAFTIAGAASDRSLSGAVELIEPMGAETLLHVRVGEIEVRVVVAREIRVRPGHVVHLAADPTQLHIFDENGKAVRQ
jgi:ABC-type sugar transport system ATPase subunit